MHRDQFNAFVSVWRSDKGQGWYRLLKLESQAGKAIKRQSLADVILLVHPTLNRG